MRLRHEPTRPTPIALAPGFIAAVALACAIPAVAQQAPASYARMVVIVPKPGHAAADFDAAVQPAATLGTPYTLSGLVDRVDNELLRYRPNLSYRP